MATYTPIEHGKANWDKDLNDNFAKIFGGGVTDDSGWVDCATLLNGAQLSSQVTSGDETNRSTAILRRSISIGTAKLIIITGALAFKKSDVPISKTLVKLPIQAGVAGYQADGIIMGAGNSNKTIAKWSLYSNGTEAMISSISFDPSMTDNDIVHLPVRFMYIAN